MVQNRNLNNILNELKNILQNEFGISANNINDNTPIHRTGVALNSMQMIEFTVAFEAHLGIDLPPEALIPENYTSLTKLASVISEVMES